MRNIFMISLYSGTPGSGKSLHIARRIFYKMRKKDTLIIGNFDIDIDYIKKCKGEYIYIPNHEMKPSLLIELSREYFKDSHPIEDKILLCIDECQLVFNARDWSKVGRAEWLEFFTQHRKLGFEVVLLAQFDLMIDKQIRSLIEYNYIHRKVSNFGVGGAIMSAVAMGKLFVCVKVWYPLNEKIGSEFFTANKRFYQIYNTYTIFNQIE